MASRSGKDYYLFFYNPFSARDYEVELMQPHGTGKSRILEYVIDPGNSVLSLWQQLGAPKRIDPEELRAIEAATHPRLSITMLDQESTRTYRTTLRSGSASFILFRQA